MFLTITNKFQLRITRVEVLGGDGEEGGGGWGGRSEGSGREGEEGATGHRECTLAKTPMVEPGVRLSDRGCKVL